MIFRLSILVLALIWLTACGFQLRGENLQALQNSQVYVQSNGANTLAGEVKDQLNKAGISTTNSAKDAEYVIKLEHETFRRSILSVDSNTGKVVEYEITYMANLSITGTNGDTILKLEPVTAVRDYIFDETSVLGEFTEEEILRREIAKHAAANVLRRLQTVTR
jgi:LPS-assembly lipoprotein